MENKQKTAIDWLVEQVNSDCLNSTFIQPKLIEEAKLMQREQNFKFFVAGMLAAEEGGKDFEQYYKEKYD